MQQVLPRWLWTLGLFLFAMTVISATDLLPRLGLNMPRFRLASSLSSGAVLFLILFFSGRSRWALWRLLWRTFPKLNEWVFPDLNGIWVGSVHSNWTAIEKLRDEAVSTERFDLDDLFELDRKESPIVVQIQSNIFGFKIRSYQPNTNAKSRSLSSGIERNPSSDGYFLNYTYHQENEIISATDSDSHVGASMLEMEYTDLNRANGSTWTKRRWEDGRNTAGTISLTRLSQESGYSTDQLKQFL